MLPVTCSGLHVTLGEAAILDGLSLSVPAGAWATVIGPNGAGKTTLLHALAGLVPHRGDVLVGGQRLSALGRRQRARTVALVPQSPVIPPGMSVADYVTLGRTAHISAFGSPDRNDRAVVVDLIDELDLGHLARRSVQSLSGGERQRCLLARTLAQQAPVLLLDEPTTGLDPSHAQAVLDLIATTRRQRGVTVISSMHDLTLAGSYAERLALLDGGRVVAEGPPRDVLRDDILSRHYGGRLRAVEIDGSIVVVPARPGSAAGGPPDGPPPAEGRGDPWAPPPGGEPRRGA